MFQQVAKARGKFRIRQEASPRRAQIIFNARLLLDNAHSTEALRHRPLSKNFSRGNEIRSCFSHIRPCSREHVYPAIEAGVHTTASTESRMLDYPQIVLAARKHAHGYAKLVSCSSGGLAPR